MQRASARRSRCCPPDFRSCKWTLSRCRKASSPRRYCLGSPASNPHRYAPRAWPSRRRPGKGGDVAIHARDGRRFPVPSGLLQSAADDATEICGVCIFGTPDLDFINLNPHPICQDSSDERTDNFEPELLADGNIVVVMGDINSHHPLYVGFELRTVEGRRRGRRAHGNVDGRRRWTLLNDGAFRAPSSTNRRTLRQLPLRWLDSPRCCLLRSGTLAAVFVAHWPRHGQ